MPHRKKPRKSAWIADKFYKFIGKDKVTGRTLQTHLLPESIHVHDRCPMPIDTYVCAVLCCGLYYSFHVLLLLSAIISIENSKLRLSYAMKFLWSSRTYSIPYMCTKHIFIYICVPQTKHDQKVTTLLCVVSPPHNTQ